MEMCQFMSFSIYASRTHLIMSEMAFIMQSKTYIAHRYFCLKNGACRGHMYIQCIYEYRNYHRIYITV